MKRILKKAKAKLAPAHDALVKFIAEGKPRSAKSILVEQWYSSNAEVAQAAEDRLRDKRDFDNELRRQRQTIADLRDHINSKGLKTEMSRGQRDAISVRAYSIAAKDAMREISATKIEAPENGLDPLEDWERRVNNKLDEAQVAILGLTLQVKDKGALLE